MVLPLAPRGFSSGTPVVPSPQKPTFPNSNATRNQVDEEPLCGGATSKSFFIIIYLYIYYLHDLSQTFSTDNGQFIGQMVYRPLAKNCPYVYACLQQLVLITVDDICVARLVKILLSEFPEETSNRPEKNNVI